MKNLKFTSLGRTFCRLERSLLHWRDQNEDFLQMGDDDRLPEMLQAVYHLTYEILCIRMEKNRASFLDYSRVPVDEYLFDSLEMVEMITDLINDIDKELIQRWRVLNNEEELAEELYVLKNLLLKHYMLDECYSTTINSNDLRFL